MFFKFLPFVLISLFYTTLNAAEIKGQITNELGDGLKGVKVCLIKQNSIVKQCSKSHFTDKHGFYSFKGLNANPNYVVKVITDISVKSKKANPYPNYVWIPMKHNIEVISKSDIINGINFTGIFNFSNFQTEFQLTSTDFPELLDFDLVNDYVYLKVYSHAPETSEQNLIFLGQVTDFNKLLIEVSVPLSEQQLLYELYSFNNPTPVIGVISLVN